MGLIVMTDSNADIPYQKLDSMDVQVLYMPYYIDGEQFFHDMGRGDRTEEFFKAMREGRETTTSLLPPARYVQCFEPTLANGDDIVFICMSSALSGTYANAHLARNELLEKYPERRLEIIDGRGMSIGMAAATELALKLRDEGVKLDTLVKDVEDLILRTNYLITVDDLNYLRKSGRLTGTTAFFATVLDIKPFIRFDYEGRLIPTERVKGRKNSLRVIAQRIKSEIVNPQGQVLRIAQADAQKDAEYLRDCVMEQLPMLAGVEISFLGPVIAAHVGPGAIGITWEGNMRTPTEK